MASRSWHQNISTWLNGHLESSRDFAVVPCVVLLVVASRSRHQNISAWLNSQVESSRNFAVVPCVVLPVVASGSRHQNISSWRIGGEESSGKFLQWYLVVVYTWSHVDLSYIYGDFDEYKLTTIKLDLRLIKAKSHIQNFSSICQSLWEESAESCA